MYNHFEEFAFMSNNRLGTYVIVRHIRVLRILKFGVNIIHPSGLNRTLNDVFNEACMRIGDAKDITTLNRIKYFFGIIMLFIWKIVLELILFQHHK